MKFLEVLDGAEVLLQHGNPEITGIEYDSRQVRQGNVFVAMRGEKTDGNRYVDSAIKAGAAAVVSDSAEAPPSDQIGWAHVPHGRRALARLSANFYQHPAERLANTGVTGTNGKTTTSYLIESILNAEGRKCSLVGTVEYHVAEKTFQAPHTTPEALELNRLFSDALGSGVSENVMEVSSHALAQQRVHGVPFDTAVFTNLTRDHLDYHGTFEDYFAAKRVLFEGCGAEPPRVAVVNADDEYGRRLVAAGKSNGSQVLLYGLVQGDFRTDKVDIGPRGTRFDLVLPDAIVPLFSSLIGKVNVYNILAAAAAAYARGCGPEAISAGVSNLGRVPGRFEQVDGGQPFTVVVDYAHTDDALRNLTALAREFVRQAGAAGRVITIFGCGGDRDRSKRPLMGEAAGTGSDFVVITSDNPRSEDPMAIIRDALPGVQKTRTRFVVEPERRRAIELALQEARPGDIVLIAGKGHENTQTTRDGVAPFDDVTVARESLSVLGYQQLATASLVKVRS